MKVDLKSMSGRQMEDWAKGHGLEPYRGRQIRHWMFKRLVSSFEKMTDLPKGLRKTLEQEALINTLDILGTEVSRDGTKKYLFQTGDTHRIETVLIPERDHYTLCVSSQAGCAMNCRFCLTGRQGLKRDLKASEIIDQVIQVKRELDEPERMTNIVFMGMGEPLANYREVTRAIETLTEEDGMNFSHRKVTLSTCGIIRKIGELGLDVKVNLAVSLNAADEETRNFLMPVNRWNPLKELVEACRNFPLPNRRMITFEYVLVDGVNSGERDARNLARLLSGIRAKINLIPLNPYPGLDLSPPPMDRILRFQEILVNRNYTAIIRKSKGEDISAACGQLSGKADRDQAA
ncbi:MAG: 23S rRNA (adenine(2503)-C(2))-methyltransferase RlmN [Deltaproteobacteria bacterium]|nr:23S rRNA (adenine(2503)-C(2))-methyltransferase RlmN [Deltaproteobacteria bacterium]